MNYLTETIQGLTLSEKVELYHLLGSDKELNDYIYTDKRLFDELNHRDHDVSTGKLQLLTRDELTNRLKQRRDAL